MILIQLIKVPTQWLIWYINEKILPASFSVINIAVELSASMTLLFLFPGIIYWWVFGVSLVVKIILLGRFPLQLMEDGWWLQTVKRLGLFSNSQANNIFIYDTLLLTLLSDLLAQVYFLPMYALIVYGNNKSYYQSYSPDAQISFSTVVIYCVISLAAAGVTYFLLFQYIRRRQFYDLLPEAKRIVIDYFWMAFCSVLAAVASSTILLNTLTGF